MRDLFLDLLPIWRQANLCLSLATAYFALRWLFGWWDLWYPQERVILTGLSVISGAGVAIANVSFLLAEPDSRMATWATPFFTLGLLLICAGMLKAPQRLVVEEKVRTRLRKQQQEPWD